MRDYMDWLFEGGPESVHRLRATAPLAIEEYEVAGVPIHAAHAHGGDHAFMDRGVVELGAVGYSLLRSQLFRGMPYQERRLEVLKRRIRGVRRYAKRAELEGHGPAGETTLDERSLLMWELIETFAQSAEQLGTLFTASRRFQAGEDLGVALLDYRGPAWREIQGRDFANLEWWNELFDLLPGNPARDALGPGDMFMLLMINRDARFRVEQAVAELRHIYDRPLHRVAQRFKHALPLTHVGYGLRWDPEDDDQRARVQRIFAKGALTLVDQEIGSRKQQRQFVVPTSNRDIGTLMIAIEQARWLATGIASSLVQRAEHPSHGVVLLDPKGKSQPELDELARIVAIYGDLGSEAEATMHEHARERSDRARAARSSTKAHRKSKT